MKKRPLTRADAATPEGRGRARYRRAALSGVAAGGARAISILTVLVSIPLAVGYLGAERYGLWATLSTLIALLGFADVGLGNGVVTAVAEADGRGDRRAARGYVSSAFFFLLGIGVVLGAMFAFAFPFIPWGAVYNVHSSVAVAEAGTATAVFAACFLLTLPASVGERTQLAYQEGYINGLWAAFGSLLGLAGVLLAIAVEASLPWLVLAFAGGPLVALLANSAMLFLRRRPWLRPRLEAVGRDAAKHLMRLGLLFAVLQLAVSVSFSSDNIVVAQLFGPEAVTEYSVTMRLFAVIPMILTILFNPLWPAYGEALARGDVTWVKSTLVRSLALAFGATAVVASVLVAFGGSIARLWVGPSVTPTFWLLLGFAGWAVLTATGNALAMFLNGVNVIRLQAAAAVALAVGALPAKVLLGDAVGLPGVIWGTVIVYAVVAALPFAFVTPRLVRRVAASAGSPAAAKSS